MNLGRIKKWIENQLVNVAGSYDSAICGDDVNEAFEILDYLRDLIASEQTVSVCVRVGENIEIPKSVYDEIQFIIDDDKKMRAIKKLRNYISLGLREAKEAVENKSNWNWDKCFARRWGKTFIPV